MFKTKSYLVATEQRPRRITMRHRDTWCDEYHNDRRMAEYLQSGGTPYFLEYYGILNAWARAQDVYSRRAERWHRENPGDAGEAELRRLSLQVIRRYVRHPKCNEPEE